MAHIVVMIHTVPLLIQTFNRLGAHLLPDVEFLHILNEVLIERVRLNGGSGPKEMAWLRDQVAGAVDIHASAVLVTCTILSSCVDEIRKEFVIPILKIDEAMVQHAVELGNRIGIIVTNPDTIDPSTELIQAQAARAQKAVTIKTALVENAFVAVRNGDAATHDLLVRKAILEMAPDVDVIVLAQASMARVLETLPEAERPVPILSSPYLALEQLGNHLTAV